MEAYLQTVFDPEGKFGGFIKVWLNVVGHAYNQNSHADDAIVDSFIVLLRTMLTLIAAEFGNTLTMNIGVALIRFQHRHLHCFWLCFYYYYRHHGNECWCPCPWPLAAQICVQHQSNLRMCVFLDGGIYDSISKFIQLYLQQLRPRKSSCG